MIFGENSERRQLERAMRDAGRLPPGQSLTLKWPVLHIGTVPRFDPATWDFRVTGLVERPLRLTWKEFSSLPMKEITADMHCVTRWSRFDVRWEGVQFAEVMKLAAVKPEAKFAMVAGDQGYTSNVPLEDLMHPATLFALKHNGEPLPGEHGYPLRLVVPHLYAWKSVKWVRGLEFMAEDAPGFWEANGCHFMAIHLKSSDTAADSHHDLKLFWKGPNGEIREAHFYLYEQARGRASARMLQSFRRGRAAEALQGKTGPAGN